MIAGGAYFRCTQAVSPTGCLAQRQWAVQQSHRGGVGWSDGNGYVLRDFLSGNCRGCYWKWPSRNSEFFQLWMVIFHSYGILPDSNLGKFDHDLTALFCQSLKSWFTRGIIPEWHNIAGEWNRFMLRGSTGVVCQRENEPDWESYCENMNAYYRKWRLTMDK